MPVRSTPAAGMPEYPCTPAVETTRLPGAAGTAAFGPVGAAVGAAVAAAAAAAGRGTAAAAAGPGAVAGTAGPGAGTAAGRPGAGADWRAFPAYRSRPETADSRNTPERADTPVGTGIRAVVRKASFLHLLGCTIVRR